MKFLVGFFSLEWMRIFDFLAPLAIRLFLAPMFWISGVKRLGLFSSSDFVIYNPLTWVNTEAFQQSVASMSNTLFSGMGAETLVILLGSIEIAAAILLVLGFAVRWVVLALMFVVVVLGLLSMGEAGFLNTMQQLVMSHGYTNMTNNLTEVYLVYFIMLLALFFMGAGRWFSLDWYIYRSFMQRIDNKAAVKQDPFEIDATDEPGIK
ncbi:MAG TPA: DoxX family protein [Candidatus Thiothrix moscowensis]|uniref:DoxX family protein n=1 Tax=unclassified Thiothrix TaxID=2636184 RepID=UPI001A1DB807|nr:MULTISPECIES: DoxX family protein [unclassified Thiothrix]MBJ6610777.1 DoxX family protein [Candidatus Thiothrix moscowensis]HRJ51163.1 DoxX family protein [Candidatus Thiothrix moscowensis]HRJ91782.1 DoxX family protein [Candidatus Thiothrix moscowensis]